MPTNTDETPLRWELTGHICRVCWARVMTRTTFESKRVHRCSSCGTQVECEQPAGLCACGIKLRNGRDAGIRCKANDHRTPENPAEIIAEQVDPASVAR